MDYAVQAHPSFGGFIDDYYQPHHYEHRARVMERLAGTTKRGDPVSLSDKTGLTATRTTFQKTGKTVPPCGDPGLVESSTRHRVAAWSRNPAPVWAQSPHVKEPVSGVHRVAHDLWCASSGTDYSRVRWWPAGNAITIS